MKKRAGLFLVVMFFILAPVTLARAEDKDCKNAFVTDVAASALKVINLQYQREISGYFNFNISIAIETEWYGETLSPDFTLRVNPFGQGLKGLYIGPKVLGVYVIKFEASQVGLGLELGYEGILWNFLVINPALDMRGYFYKSWDSDDSVYHLTPYPIPCLRIGYAW